MCNHSFVILCQEKHSLDSDEEDDVKDERADLNEEDDYGRCQT